jgi:phasin family protein
MLHCTKEISMNQNVENAISRIADDARARYAELLHDARQKTEQAAGQVTRGKKPLKTISRLGLKLTAVTHRTADKVLKQNTKLVEHQIDAIAERLKAAADARDLRELVGTQVRMIPESASRMASDAREALNIVVGAGGEVGQILQGTAAELRGKSPATKARAAKKPARKKAARKTSRKSAPAKTAPIAEAPAS